MICYLVNIFSTIQKRTHDFTMQQLMKLAILLIGFSLLTASPIFAQQTIKFGLHQNKPLNFRDTDNQVKGLVIDVFTYIAEQENWEIEYVPCDWGDCLDKLEKGDIDVLSAIGYTKKRHNIYDFTSNSLITNWGLVVTQPGTTIQSILDLDGKTVAVMKRAGHTMAFRKLLDNFNINAKYLVVDDFLSVFRLVHEKKVDAGVVNRLIASQYVHDYNVLKSSIIFNPIEIRYAFTKNCHTEMISAVDRYLIKLRGSSNSIYFQSIDRWFGDKKTTSIPIWLKWLGVFTLLAIGILVVLNSFLNYRVKQKTKQLEKEISEHKQTEKALQKSETILKDAQKVAHIGHWELDPSIGIPVWSDEIFRIFGLNPNESEPSFIKHETYIHPDDWLIVEKAIEKGYMDGSPFALVFRIVRPSGEIGWMHAIGTALISNAGKVIKLFGTAQDITMQKQAEDKIKYSKLQFEAVLNNLDSSIYITDMKSNEILFTNQHMKDVFGKNLTGKICWQAIHNNLDGPCGFCTNDKLIDADGISNKPYVWEMYNQNLQQWYELRDQAIPWTDGRLVRMEIATNITDRKNTEDALRESEEKYRSMMESMKDAAYICSPELCIEYINPTMIDRIGRDATGEICYKAIYNRDEKCPWCVFDKVQKGDKFDYEIADPKDNRYYSVANAPIFRSDGIFSIASR